jgi:hypothetical protein
VYPNAAGTFPQGALLATAGLSRPLIERLNSLFTEHVGSIEDVWTALKHDPDFAQEGRVETLQFTMQVSAIARGHVPLVQALQQMRQSGTFASARDLARATENDWLALILGRERRPGAGFPPDTPGRDDAEKATNYARVLAQSMEALFPSAVVAMRIIRAQRPGTEDLARFFASNPMFELGTTHRRHLELDAACAAAQKHAARLQDYAALRRDAGADGRGLRLRAQHHAHGAVPLCGRPGQAARRGPRPANLCPGGSCRLDGARSCGPI